MSATNHTLNTGHQSARLPIILDRKKIRIRPTRNGLIFIVLVLAMFLGSLNYNNNLGFILTFLLGSLAFVSIAHTYKNVAGIAFGSSFAQPVFAGQKAVFEFIIPGDTATRVRIGFSFRDCQIAYYDLTAHEDNRVRVLVREQLLRRYTLTYEDHETSGGISRLSHVTTLGSDGATPRWHICFLIPRENSCRIAQMMNLLKFGF